MQQIDASAIDAVGIPRLLLMEHAGLAVVRAVHHLVPDPSAPLVICCGTGWNGGDGLAAARHLHERGHPLRVAVTGPLDRLREEPAAYARILRGLGVAPVECLTAEALGPLDEWLAECRLVIDALLGIGARGAVREPAASMIERINRSGKPVVAVDIPSGLDADTGRIQGVAVRATMTVTFGLAKRGCLLAEGPAHTGTLVVDPITIPRRLLETAAA
ncbi:MAG: NAD(P)H-hydrate epimerase [Candidatus Omnitrophica bacterium]|nr:NAD(P)H-hydrate epimerase [Candidatus Omnitrophota bacterium]